MNRKLILSIAALAVTSALASAQNVVDLAIVEACPDSTLMDDYGRKTGWIEIYNTSQGTVNYGGCYLTNDKNNLTKSLIQKGYKQTSLGPTQTVVFYASGRGEDGLFYTDFTVERGDSLYLVSNDGRTIVDSIYIPEDLPQGVSVIKLPVDNKGLEYVQQDEPAVISPGMKNGDQNEESKSQIMARTDRNGFVLTLVSVSVVFIALAILWFLFWILFERPANKKAEAAAQPKKGAKAKHVKTGGADEIAAAVAMALDMENGGDIYAAIATALHLYYNDNAHDAESFVITIKPSNGSMWSDKTQTFRKLPR